MPNIPIQKVEVVPVFVDTLGILTDKIKKWLGKIGTVTHTEIYQKTTLLRKARILRKCQYGEVKK